MNKLLLLLVLLMPACTVYTMPGPGYASSYGYTAPSVYAGAYGPYYQAPAYQVPGYPARTYTVAGYEAPRPYYPAVPVQTPVPAPYGPAGRVQGRPAWAGPPVWAGRPSQAPGVRAHGAPAMAMGYGRARH